MGIVESIIVILIIIWLAGFFLNFAGGLIHVLLVIAVVIFIYRMLMRRV